MVAPVSAGKRLDGVLGNGPFLRLVAGVTFSRVGDAMTFIVVSWLALRAGGPGAVGLVAFAAGCAGPVTAPVIGHLIDRLGLRPLMLADNLIRGCLMAGLAVLADLGLAGLAYLVAFAVGAALLSPATELARDVALPALVGEGQLDAASRLLASSWDVAAWLGPAAAGIAMGVIGHQGPAVYGLLVSLAGFACLVGTLCLTPLVTHLGYGPALIVVLAVRGLAVLPIASAGSWGLAAVFVALAAVPDGSFFPISATCRSP